MISKIIINPLFLFSFFVFAQEIPLENPKHNHKIAGYTLQRSVVSASGFIQELKDAPASISVITKEQLEDKPFRDIAEAVSTIPGVAKTDEGISIRGMPASYTLILIDGKRQNITSSVFANGFGESVFSSFMPPLAAIERIEVIKGPMSTLYGSDAIGGVVNIITKKNFERWSSSFVLQTTLEEEKLFGNLYGGSFYTSGPLDSAKKWGLSLRGSEIYRAFVPMKDLKIVPDGSKNKILGLSESNAYNIGGRISYSPNKENYFYFDYKNTMQYYNNAQALVGTLGVANKGGYAKNIYFTQNNALLAHLGKYSFGKTNTSIQYLSTTNSGRVITQAFIIDSDPDSIRSLLGEDRGLRSDEMIAEFRLDFSFGRNWYSHHMKVGAKYSFSSMQDKLIFNHDFMYSHNGALFVEDEWSFLDNLFLTLDVRENYHSAFGFNTSPRAYLVYNAFDWLTLKGGVSTGYKAPKVNQLLEGVNGAKGKDSSITYGNPYLKPERSLSYELSILSESAYMDVGITGFFNTFEDKIQTRKALKTEFIPVFGGGYCLEKTDCAYSVNIDSAKTYGVEVFLGVKPIDIIYGNIGLNLNYTFTKTKITSGADRGLEMSSIPEHNLNGSLNYAIGNLGLYLRAELRINQSETINASDLEKFKANNMNFNSHYKNYGLLHLGGHYKINKYLTIHAGIYNLLNHNFVDYYQRQDTKNKTKYVNSYDYIREGRRYFISLNMDF